MPTLSKVSSLILLLSLAGCGVQGGSALNNEAKALSPVPTPTPVPGPSILFSPASGAFGTVVTITSTNVDLSTLASASVNGTPALILGAAASSAMIFVMPGTSSGAVAISTASGSLTSASSFSIASAAGPTTKQAILYDASGSTAGLRVGLSADGNTAVLGGHGYHSNTGAAWVYTKSGGAWTMQSILSDATAPNGYQGYSVAVSGDGNTVIVGGPYTASIRGAAWIYVRSGTSWTQQAKLFEPTAANAAQGWQVALSADGNTALVAGQNYQSGNGGAWIYVRSGSTWTLQALLTDPASPGNGIGTSAALSADGNTAILGAPGANSGAGGAWVFTRSGVTWSQQTILLDASAVNAQQGYSVALSADGNEALIGSNYYNSIGGAVVFTRSGSTWTQGAWFCDTSQSVSAGQGEGVALSADGQRAFVGGSGYASNHGGVWVYSKSGATWANDRILTDAGAGSASQGFGIAVSGDGSVLLSGGAYYNSGVGAGWVYTP